MTMSLMLLCHSTFTLKPLVVIIEKQRMPWPSFLLWHCFLHFNWLIASINNRQRNDLFSLRVKVLLQGFVFSVTLVCVVSGVLQVFHSWSVLFARFSFLVCVVLQGFSLFVCCFVSFHFFWVLWVFHFLSLIFESFSLLVCCLGFFHFWYALFCKFFTLSLLFCKFEVFVLGVLSVFSFFFCVIFYFHSGSMLFCEFSFLVCVALWVFHSWSVSFRASFSFMVCIAFASSLFFSAFLTWCVFILFCLY